MKTTLKLLTLACIISLSSCVVHRTVVVEQAPPPTNYTPAPEQQQPVQQQQPVYQEPYQQTQTVTTYSQPAGYDQFYNSLSPYGNWVTYQNYGYCWIPNAGPNFTPYSTGGHWVYTDYGWTWASDYSWGWAPFHYGRWTYDAYYGWIWIPGNTWGPAWVAWRSYGSYYGWAPMCPGEVDYHNSYYSSGNYWVFCDRGHLNDPNPQRYYAPREQYNVYVSNSTEISNTYHDNQSNANYYTGPRREEVQTYTGGNIAPVHINNLSSANQTASTNKELYIYRPPINNSNNTIPNNVTSINNVTSLPNRAITTQPKPINPNSNVNINRGNVGNNGNGNVSNGNNGGLPRPNSGNSNNMQPERPVNNTQQEQRPVENNTQMQRPVNNQPEQRQPENNTQMQRPVNNPQPQQRQVSNAQPMQRQQKQPKQPKQPKQNNNGGGRQPVNVNGSEKKN